MQRIASEVASSQEEDTASLASDPLGVDDLESVNFDNDSSDLQASSLEEDINIEASSLLAMDNNDEESQLSAQLLQEL